MIERIRCAIEHIQESQAAETIGLKVIEAFRDWIIENKKDIWENIEDNASAVLNFVLKLLTG